ncbi:hypothetical protein D3C75_776830 [compost metagenome]
MLNAVLHQGLQGQLRHGAAQELLRHLDVIVEQLLEAELLDLQIAGEMLKLLLHRNHILLLDADPQDIAQPRHHLADLAALVLHRQYIDGLQRIEQKMRIDLGLQRLKLRQLLALLLAHHLMKQLRHPGHQAVEALCQQRHFIRSYHREPCRQIPPLHHAHELHRLDHLAGHPVGEEQ